MGVLGGPDPTDWGVVGSEQECSAPVGHPWCPYLLSSGQHPAEAGRPSGQAAPTCMSQPVLPALLPRHIHGHLPVTKEKPKLDNENTLDKGLVRGGEVKA